MTGPDEDLDLPMWLRQPRPPRNLRNLLACQLLIWALALSDQDLIGWFVKRVAWREGWRPRIKRRTRWPSAEPGETVQ